MSMCVRVNLFNFLVADGVYCSWTVATSHQCLNSCLLAVNSTVVHRGSLSVTDRFMAFICFVSFVEW